MLVSLHLFTSNSQQFYHWWVCMMYFLRDPLAAVAVACLCMGDYFIKKHYWCFCVNKLALGINICEAFSSRDFRASARETRKYKVFVTFHHYDSRKLKVGMTSCNVRIYQCFFKILQSRLPKAFSLNPLGQRKLIYKYMAISPNLWMLLGYSSNK